MESFIAIICLLAVIFICTVVAPITLYMIYNHHHNINSYKNKVMVLSEIGYAKVVKVEVSGVLTEKIDYNTTLTYTRSKKVVYYRNDKHPSYPVILDEDVKSMSCIEILDFIIDEIGNDVAGDDSTLMNIYYNILDKNVNTELIGRGK